MSAKNGMQGQSLVDSTPAMPVITFLSNVKEKNTIDDASLNLQRIGRGDVS